MNKRPSRPASEEPVAERDWLAQEQALSMPAGRRADALLARQPENPAIALGQGNHAGNLRPAKAGGGHMAGAVDGIGDTQRLGVVIVCPPVGVIVQPDGAIPSGRDVDMVRQCEILEAQLGGNRAQRLGRGGEEYV